MIEHDGIWAMLSESEKSIRDCARKLSDRKDLPWQVHRFFEQAGELVRHSWHSYPFASIGFFYAVMGVEKALRMTFVAQADAPFKKLFNQAVEQEILHDGIFETLTPIPKELKNRVPKGLRSHAAILANLVPRLRNDYVHGNFMVSCHFLPLSLQLREVADALSAVERP